MWNAPVTASLVVDSHWFDTVTPPMGVPSAARVIPVRATTQDSSVIVAAPNEPAVSA